MRVIYRQESLTLLQFLTSVCAVVGGVFTVAGLIDGFIYNANRTLKRKIQLGKAN
jgi:endoplasmic reticulum-Golgi intermediate compartment protein 3